MILFRRMSIRLELMEMYRLQHAVPCSERVSSILMHRIVKLAFYLENNDKHYKCILISLSEFI